MELRTGRNKTQVGLLLLPGVAMFAIFTIYPVIKLFMMSFLQWDFGSMLSHKFIGLENYKAVLGMKHSASLSQIPLFIPLSLCRDR